MAEEHQQHSGEKVVGEEVTDRGLFDFLGKKKEHEHVHDGEGKCEEATVTEVEKAEGEALATEFEKVQVTEPAVKEEEKKEGLLEKLHRSHSSSSSSSSDEEDAAEGAEGEKKKKKKKSLKDKIKEKISGEKKEEAAEEHKVEADQAAAVVVEDNTIPVEKIDELAPPEYSDAQEKKSLLDKIKEKLPGGKKPAEEAAAAPVAVPAEQGADHQLGKEHGNEGDSPKEKKGFLGKIMDKIPGYHKGTGPEESSAAAH